MLHVGDMAPDFTAVDHEGKSVQLSGLRGRRVVLYFYPKDDTPGCTAQACAFRDLHQEIAQMGAVILGVSPDSPGTHQRFRQKYNLPFTLISDPEKAIAEAYGVLKDKKMFGRAYKGVERTTFIIGPEGRIEAVISGIQAQDHPEATLSALKEK